MTIHGVRECSPRADGLLSLEPLVLFHTCHLTINSTDVHSCHTSCNSLRCLTQLSPSISKSYLSSRMRVLPCIWKTVQCHVTRGTTRQDAGLKMSAECLTTNSLTLRMGRIFSSKFWIFERFPAIQFENLQLYKQISLKYFPSCPLPQNRSRAIFNFLT